MFKKLIFILVVVAIFSATLAFAEKDVNVTVTVNQSQNTYAPPPPPPPAVYVYDRPSPAPAPAPSYTKGGDGFGVDSVKLSVLAMWLPTNDTLFNTNVEGVIPYGIGLEYGAFDILGMVIGIKVNAAYAYFTGLQATYTYTDGLLNYSLAADPMLYVVEAGVALHFFPGRKLDLYAQVLLGYTGLAYEITGFETQFAKGLFYGTAGLGLDYYVSRDWYVGATINFILSSGNFDQATNTGNLKFSTNYYNVGAHVGVVF